MHWLVAFTLALTACKKPPSTEQLVEAVEAGRVEDVQRMLGDDAKPNARDQYGRCALIIAAMKGHLQIVEALLRHRADPAFACTTMLGGIFRQPLQEAAFGGHLEIVRRLLAAKAPVEGEAGSSSPLSLAAQPGHIEIAELLLAAGAKVDALGEDGRGYPPLAMAAKHGHLKLVQRLLAAGARVDLRDALGFTALNYACVDGHSEVAARLLAAGADPLAANRAGWTPAFTAQFNEREDIVAMLRAAGVTDFGMRDPPSLPGGGPTIRVPVVETNALP